MPKWWVGTGYKLSVLSDSFIYYVIIHEDNTLPRDFDVKFELNRLTPDGIIATTVVEDDGF